jgi:hypothetical protein
VSLVAAIAILGGLWALVQRRGRRAAGQTRLVLAEVAEAMGLWAAGLKTVAGAPVEFAHAGVVGDHWVELGGLYAGGEVDVRVAALINDASLLEDCGGVGAPSQVAFAARASWPAGGRICRLFVAGGSVGFELGLPVQAAQLKALVEEAIWLAEALAPKEAEVKASLAHNAEFNPVPAVRHRCLESLIERYPRDEWTARALRAARSSAAASDRLRAAVLMPRDEAKRVLEAMVSSPDDGCPVELRIRALAELVRRRPAFDCTAILEGALQSPDWELRCAALDLSRRAPSPALAVAIGRLSGSPSVAERVAVGQALGKLGLAVGESTLLVLLGDLEPVVQINAACSLRWLGSGAALPALLRLAALREGDPRVTLAARDAIRSIQARRGVEEDGAMQLVEPSAQGAVALAAETGALALAGIGGEAPRRAESTARPIAWRSAPPTPSPPSRSPDPVRPDPAGYLRR